MLVTVELPEDALARLRAEAARRGVSIDVVIAELAAHLPPEDPLEAFIGCGASGRTEPFDIHHERAELAAKKLAEGLRRWSASRHCDNDGADSFRDGVSTSTGRSPPGVAANQISPRCIGPIRPVLRRTPLGDRGQGGLAVAQR